MTRFLGEKIEVEKGEISPYPVSFKWRDQVYTVAEVLQEWVDISFGQAPPRSCKWYNRRHRRHFIVKTTSGDVYQMYYDYADKRGHTWWLVEKVERNSTNHPP